jgi:hypothetical protein
MSCIVVFRTSDRVVMAADSASLTADPQGGSASLVIRPQQKIKIFRQWAVTLAGFSRCPNGVNAVGRAVAAIAGLFV